MAGKERDARGQVIVIFALALVALVAAVGLVLDGGATFAQRRDQQSAADLAALAAANDYLLNHDVALASARARSVTEENGFEDGVDDVSVSVSIDTSNGAEVTVGHHGAAPQQLRWRRRHGELGGQHDRNGPDRLS